MDAARLLGRLVEEELETAGRVLVVDLERGRGLEEDRRAVDLDDRRLDLAASRVLDRHAEDELLPRLQRPQRIVGFLRAGPLLDDDDLAAQEVLLHVVERLRRQPREEDDLFRWREPLEQLGQAALAGARLREDERRERVLELARDDDQVAERLVGLLADVAEAREVLDDALEQLRLLEVGERRRRLFFRELGRFRSRGGSRFLGLVRDPGLGDLGDVAELTLNRLLASWNVFAPRTTKPLRARAT